MPPLDPRVPNGIAPPSDMPVPVVGQSQGPATPPAMAAQVAAIRGAQATPTEDGGMLLDLAGPQPEVPEASGPDAHDTNLAEHLDDATLARIATEVLEGVEADLDSNQPFFDAVKQGIALLGLEVAEADDPFEGASGAIHPMLLIALVRFVANARGELQPAGGPAKVKTEATPEPAVRMVAQRKERWLNYYLTVEDRGYYRDCDAGWLWLGLYGSIFRKVYDDPVTGKPRSRFLTPLSLLVSWHAPDLESALRATHIDTISTAEAERRRLAGYYVEHAAFEASDYAAETPEGQQRAETDKRTPSDREEDAEQVHYHSHVLLDLGRFEDGITEEGQPEGLPIPYVVTVDKRTEKVLRIERDWKAGDPLFTRRDTYAHFLLHPGLGFYGWSFVTLLAATTNTASTLWRQAINTFMLHTHPGGLRAKGMRPESENLTVGPGEFAEVDTGGLPIDQAVMPLPYRDLPASFPPLFETVVNAGQTLGQTQELQVGEGRQDAPVGTTLALLEAAIKPTAAMFKRLHEAQGHELRILADRFGREKGAVYPFLVDGQRGKAIAADFADNADVYPVSDPNIPTQTQRLAQAQAVLQLAMGAGGAMDLRAALEDMLICMGRSPQEIQRLMPPPNQGQPADVATEFALALKGMPLAVGPEQDHFAHISTHLPILQTPGLPPPVQGALMAHIAEHVAAWYRQQAEIACREQGIMLPPPGAPIPPQIEQAMSLAVARVSDTIAGKLGGMLGAGLDPSKQAELAYKREELAFKRYDSERKAEETARQDQTELLKLRQESLDAQADREAKQQEMMAKTKLEVIKQLGNVGKQHMQGEHAAKAADQAHAHSLEAAGHDQLHQRSEREAAEKDKHIHAARDLSFKAQEGQATRLHTADEAQRSRQHEAGISMMGHLAGALGQDAERRAAAADAQAGRQHDMGMADADRRHQTGIAAMGHQAGLMKQKMAGDTTLQTAKMRPKPAATGAKPKASKVKGKKA